MKFEKIWSENRRQLRAFIRSRVASPADAEDLLQETSLKAFKAFSQLEVGSSSRGWLFQIARRTIIDFYRKQSAARAVSADDLSHGQDVPDGRQDLVDCIGPLLLGLPGDVRQTLTAVHLEGQSQREFAAAKGLDYSAAKSRVQRGRAALRLAFETCCDMAFDRRGQLSDCTYKPGVERKC